MHSNTLEAEENATKAPDGSDPATQRKKRGQGKRMDEEQPMTGQRHGPRARPAVHGPASVDCVPQTERDIGTAIPDARAIAH